MVRVSAVILALVCVHYARANPLSKRSTVATEFIILHTNDMHARFEQTDRNSGTCTTEDADNDNCYGGFARVAHEVRKYRTEAENGGTPVFFLNAGDTYTGTAWFTVFKDEIATAFLNKLQPDAISLGNHEFDKNIDGLIPHLNNVEFPVLACNLDLTKTPELANTKHLGNSTILETNGVKIGIIGYLTPDTEHLATPNSVKYFEEIVSINAEAEKLKEQGINIIIALGHSGYQKDKEIAKNCPDVDIVVGGHSHSFLYGDQEIVNSFADVDSGDAVRGPYPTIVQQDDKKVPVVQAYAYTKYLGKLHVKFDEDGNLIEFNGAPILLDASVEQEADVLELLEVYRPNITALDTDVIGYTKVFLEGADVCRLRECNLGNMIADSMIHARVLEYEEDDYWTDAPIAIMQGGGIRSSIAKRSDGVIVASDVMTVLPFENELHITKISGKKLRIALEHSAAVRTTDSNGGYLQFSGIHVVYNYNNPEGQRVISVDVRCAECSVPTYSSLIDTDYYNVIAPDFLISNGDGYDLLEDDESTTIRLGLDDQDALIQYIKNHETIYPELEGRIAVEQSNENSDSGSGYTKVKLQAADECITKECNTGNFITDAMVHARVLEVLDGDYWTDAAIALFPATGILNSIVGNSDNSVTGADVLNTTISQNNLYVTELSGLVLRNVLEKSTTTGEFLQFSGLRIHSYADREIGNRLSIESLCAECNVPTYSELNNTANYKVILPEALINGNFGYTISGNSQTIMGKTVIGAVNQFLEQRQFIYPELQERIVFIAGDSGASAAVSSVALLLIVSIITQFFG